MQDSCLISHLLLLEIVAVSNFAQSYAFLSRDIDMSLLYLLSPAVVTNWVTTGKKILRGHWSRSIFLNLLEECVKHSQKLKDETHHINERFPLFILKKEHIYTKVLQRSVSSCPLSANC